MIYKRICFLSCSFVPELLINSLLNLLQEMQGKKPLLRPLLCTLETSAVVPGDLQSRRESPAQMCWGREGADLWLFLWGPSCAGYSCYTEALNGASWWLFSILELRPLCCCERVSSSSAEVTSALLAFDGERVLMSPSW